MPSLDPIPFLEPEEDRALRDELKGMLGVPENGFFEAKATPEMNALADRLRMEAARRRRQSHIRPTWMLLAAGLPIALVLAGVGSWGLAQKRRADALAATVEAKNVELQHANAETAKVRQTNLELASNLERQQPLKARPATATGARPLELVIPVNASGQTHALGNVEQVKATDK